MNTLTKLALGLLGQLKPLPPVGVASPLRALLSPSLSGAMPLTLVWAWFDRDALARAMGLQADHQLLLSQTVGAINLAQPA